jgi:hypothetical protein
MQPLDLGCMLSINPDAQSIPELDHMHWGVEMGRKGGVPADRVLNGMPLGEIMRNLKRKRRFAARAARRRKAWSPTAKSSPFRSTASIGSARCPDRR